MPKDYSRLFTWDQSFWFILRRSFEAFSREGTNTYFYYLNSGGQRNENTERGDMGWIKQAFTKDDSYDLLNPEQGMSHNVFLVSRGLTSHL